MFGANILQSLAARPPTPPRDTQSEDIEEGLDQAIEFLDDSFKGNPAILNLQDTIRQSDTPERSPSSSVERLSSSRTTGSTAFRKVNFAPFILWDYHNSPIHPPTVQVLPVKPLTPSRNRVSRKSILKPFKMTPINAPAIRPYDTLQSMLEETVDVLREGDVATRVNAYGKCLHTLQNFDSFPDTQSLADHSNQLLHFIRRDMEIEPSADPDNLKIAVAAIKLLIAFIRLPESTAWFDVEKLADALEFSISTVQSAATPKTVLTHHLFLLSQQKFGSRIMTPDRINRTITALTTIHEKVSGNGVRAHRLLIYRRFVDQCPTVMRARAGDWIVNLYTSILSQKRDVREQGMELGYTTALRFGNNAEMSRMVKELLDKEFENKSFGKYAIERLQELLKQKDVCVPQIWAITVLFLRGRNRKENHWNWFKPWLELASACVNSSERQIKIETIVAWRKLIYACMPDMQTIKPVRHLLKAPIEAHLKKEQDYSKGLGKHAMCTYFCLLHYSLRAGTYEQVDSYWDEYVAPVLNKFVANSEENVYHVCSLLQTMFKPRLLPGAKAAKPIEENQFDFEEPPTLEARWIRSRLDKVLCTVNSLLLTRVSWMPIDDERLDDLDHSQENTHSLGSVTWMSLMDAVRDAGLMEVTTSLELKSAIAAIVNSLHQLAQSFRQFDKGSFLPGQIFASLVQGTLQRLGPAHFAERILLRTSNNAFGVAPTPSQRPKSAGSLTCPMTHLFILELSLPSERDTAQVHLDRIRSTLVQCLNALKSRSLKLDLLGDLAEALEAFKDENGTLSDLQQDAADLLLELSEDTVLSNSSHLVSQPGMTSSDITALQRILGHLTSFLTANRIPRVLYAHLVKAARAISGDGGLLLLVTEPQASVITNWMTGDKSVSSEMLLTYATMIIENDTRPRLGSMERARKHIWGGISSSVDKFQDADLFHTNIWILFDTTLKYGMAHLGASPGITTALTDFLGAMQKHIDRSSRSFHTLIKFTQNALSAILLDENRKLKDVARTTEGARLSSTVQSLWADITDKYRNDFKSTNPASNWLDTVQDLLLAGFNSPRESIVNVTITFWNDFVDLAGDLLLDIDYPDKLIDAVVCLRSISDVRLPLDNSNKENEGHSNDRTFIAFSDYGSQPSVTPLAVRAHGPPNHRRLLSPMPEKQTSSKLPLSMSRLTPRRKLRHEDSQLVFEMIAISSPIQAADETQNLTEHQKEVLERQQDQAAALFRDIGSDDIGSSSRKLLINSDVAVASSDTDKDDISRPSTPDVGGQEGPEEEVQSSPIAASQSRRQNRSSSSNPVVNQEILSSPPSAVKGAGTAEADGTATTGMSGENLLEKDIAQESLDTLPDAIPDTISDEEIIMEDSTHEDQRAYVENIGGYRISSDDLPSSQLVAEMLASQSSPMPSIELEEAKTSISPTTAQDNNDESLSTASLMRAQTTVDDLFPTSFAQSPDVVEMEYQASQYQTRSKTVQDPRAMQSTIANSASLKRKRGRPRKDKTADVSHTEPERDLSSQAVRTLRSSSRLSVIMKDQVPGDERPPCTDDTTPDDCNVRRPGSQVDVPEEEEEETDIDEPSLKRRRSASSAAVSIAPLPEDEHGDLPAQVIEVIPREATSSTTLTPESILARLQSLVADARSVVWSREEQMEVGDISFELQAATRGYIPNSRLDLLVMEEH